MVGVNIKSIIQLQFQADELIKPIKLVYLANRMSKRLSALDYIPDPKLKKMGCHV